FTLIVIFFFFMLRQPPCSTLFPYTTLFRSVSVDKAVDAVGLGRTALRALPTDAEFRVRLDALEAAIAEDHKRGVRPMCIVAIFGTTNTGAVDSIRQLRRIADREGMWLHADAAYGGGMLLSNQSPMRDRGLELADSITIDPHKWFYAPLDAGARSEERRVGKEGRGRGWAAREWIDRG